MEIREYGDMRDAIFVINKRGFTVRVTNTERLWLCVRDEPARMENVVDKPAIISLLRAIRKGRFDGPPSTWQSHSGQDIQWSMSADHDDSGRQVCITTESNGFRFWLTLDEFRALTDNLKSLMSGHMGKVAFLPEGILAQAC